MRIALAFAVIGLAVAAYWLGGGTLRERSLSNEVKILETIADETSRDLNADDVDNSLRDLSQ